MKKKFMISADVIRGRRKGRLNFADITKAPPRLAAQITRLYGSDRATLWSLNSSEPIPCYSEMLADMEVGQVVSYTLNDNNAATILRKVSIDQLSEEQKSQLVFKPAPGEQPPNTIRRFK